MVEDHRPPPARWAELAGRSPSAVEWPPRLRGRRRRDSNLRRPRGARPWTVLAAPRSTTPGRLSRDRPRDFRAIHAVGSWLAFLTAEAGRWETEPLPGPLAVSALWRPDPYRRCGRLLPSE